MELQSIGGYVGQLSWPYVPGDWACTTETSKVYEENSGWIEEQVRVLAGRYRIPGHDPDDVRQMARMLALCAIDHFDPERGSLKSLVSGTIYRGLAGVLGNALARKNHAPLISIDDMEVMIDPPITAREEWEDGRDVRLRLQALDLSEDARRVCSVLIETPPDLLVAERNAGPVRGRPRASSLAAHLGWTVGRVERAYRELRHAWEGSRCQYA